MELTSKTALVTGGAVRVGKAISLALAEAGVNVIINYHSSARAAQETCREAENFGVVGLPIQADIADVSQVKSMVAAAVEAFGGIDILINSASLWRETPFPLTDYSDWHAVTNVLINGSFYCANEAAPLMTARGEGAIINIVDLAAFDPWPNYIAHVVGKSAVLALNRQLALELAPLIRVNAVAPGPVLPPPDFDLEDIERGARNTLLNRWGTPDDISRAVIFLLTADYITGEVLLVDGGEHYAHRKADRR